MKIVVAALLMVITTNGFAQDVNLILKEAGNLERTLKEDEALAKYKDVLAINSDNINALIKCTSLSCAIGKRQPDKKAKAAWFDQAKQYADKALTIDWASADVCYAEGLVALQRSEIETENKKLVINLKELKSFADQSLRINPEHGKANYLLGKWHLIVATMPAVKKTALKIFYGSMPEATLDSAYKFMEKCRTLEPYYVQNFFDLARAYKDDNKPSKAIEVFNRLVKLPNRTADDAAMKEKGKQMLSEMQ